jgi:hypothetical protein
VRFGGVLRPIAARQVRADASTSNPKRYGAISGEIVRPGATMLKTE